TLYFLLAGCLFYWPLLGTRSARSRWIPLVAAAIALTVLGLVLVNWQTPIGWAFYHSLGQPWLTEPLADQRLAGRLAIAFSAVPLVLAILVRRSPGEPSPKAGSPGVRLGTTAGV